MATRAIALRGTTTTKSPIVNVRVASAKRHRRHPRMTISLAIIAGLAPVTASTIAHGRYYGMTGKEGAISEFSRTIIGIDPYDPGAGWQSWRLKYGLYPILIGMVVHKIAGWTGLNRMMAKAGIPVVRI